MYAKTKDLLDPAYSIRALARQSNHSAYSLARTLLTRLLLTVCWSAIAYTVASAATVVALANHLLVHNSPFISCRRLTLTWPSSQSGLPFVSMSHVLKGRTPSTLFDTLILLDPIYASSLPTHLNLSRTLKSTCSVSMLAWQVFHIPLANLTLVMVMLPEAIAIVMAPTDTIRSFGIFQLSDPGGITVIKQCQQRGFHPHEEPPDGSPIYDHSSHVLMNPNLRFDVIDLR
eukprot:Gb_25005 [translate_table: standard]